MSDIIMYSDFQCFTLFYKRTTFSAFDVMF